VAAHRTWNQPRRLRLRISTPAGRWGGASLEHAFCCCRAGRGLPHRPGTTEGPPNSRSQSVVLRINWPARAMAVGQPAAPPSRNGAEPPGPRASVRSHRSRITLGAMWFFNRFDPITFVLNFGRATLHLRRAWRCGMGMFPVPGNLIAVSITTTRRCQAVRQTPGRSRAAPWLPTPAGPANSSDWPESSRSRDHRHRCRKHAPGPNPQREAKTTRPPRLRMALIPVCRCRSIPPVVAAREWTEAPETTEAQAARSISRASRLNGRPE